MKIFVCAISLYVHIDANKDYKYEKMNYSKVTPHNWFFKLRKQHITYVHKH